ncbi:IclR family transcriptional regulator [Pimelobacter simplex]|uniref:IclR family transcriptional regulator n=1 Tax=Nocardioides simplex TaxID=2045 RepID=UPI00193425C0|nr:helix-turn-helix domain-containing protein [Pimelobacter simplex]
MSAADQRTHDLPQDRPGRSSVIERVTLVLDAFANGPAVLLLEDISRASGLPRSTAFRIVAQLEKSGWLTKQAPGYALGPRAHTLHASADDAVTLRAVANQTLNELREATDGVVHLGALDGSDVVYLERLGAGTASAVPSSIGARVSVERTVLGLAILAAIEPERVDRMVAVAGRDRLHAQLGAIRRRHGVAATSAAHCALGIGSVAAPIVVRGRPVGALSVAVVGRPTVRLIQPLVVDAARRVSAELALRRENLGSRDLAQEA